MRRPVDERNEVPIVDVLAKLAVGRPLDKCGGFVEVLADGRQVEVVPADSPHGFRYGFETSQRPLLVIDVAQDPREAILPLRTSLESHERVDLQRQHRAEQTDAQAQYFPDVVDRRERNAES